MTCLVRSRKHTVTFDLQIWLLQVFLPILSALCGRMLLKGIMSNTRTEITYKNNLQLKTFRCISISAMKGCVLNARSRLSVTIKIILFAATAWPSLGPTKRSVQCLPGVNIPELEDYRLPLSNIELIISGTSPHMPHMLLLYVESCPKGTGRPKHHCTTCFATRVYICSFWIKYFTQIDLTYLLFYKLFSLNVR